MRRMALVGLVLVVGVGVGVAASAALAAPAGGGTVYIATGENFPDAVTAGAAGGSADGPVLLVRQNSIPTFTFDELNRLQPFKIVIVGGTAVISTGVEDQLKALSFGPVVIRKGGADRYETAALLSQDTFPKTGAASCPGLGFFPLDSAVAYTSEFGLRWFDPSGNAVLFVCEVSLSHRATVTKLSVGIDDNDDVWFGRCRLWRMDIVGGRSAEGIGSLDQMAETPQTSGTSGIQLVTTTAITDPVVNNARYGYFIGCLTADDLKIIGATVEYELTG